MVKPRSLVPLLLSVLAGGCDLQPITTSTGIDGGLGGGGTGDGGAGVCPSAFVVVDSDYMSTDVSVVSPSGALLTGSLISSGSAPPGLTQALSGDVVCPLARPSSGSVVLIDRGNAAIDWINPTTAAVEAQLSVSTGFASDPHDYLDVAPGKAYVTRYATNTTPGMMPNDGGGDILILDTQKQVITGRIDMSDPDNGMLLPRPDRMLSIGGQVWVSLERLDATYATVGDARFAGVDPTTDQRTFELDLPKIASCGGLAVSPSGKVVAATCSGLLASTSDTSQSALVLIDATKNPPVELMRYPVAVDLGGALGPTLAFASETLLVGFAYGDMSATPVRNDVGFTLDLTTGTVAKLFDAGAPFVLGDVRCAPGCGDRCVMADAQANALRFWQITGGALVAQPNLPPDPSVGLPPRGLGEL
jgi:hypothetical protein